eukprot:Pgem_evm1s14813
MNDDEKDNKLMDWPESPALNNEWPETPQTPSEFSDLEGSINSEQRPFSLPAGLSSARGLINDSPHILEIPENEEVEHGINSGKKTLYER